MNQRIRDESQAANGPGDGMRRSKIEQTAYYPQINIRNIDFDLPPDVLQDREDTPEKNGITSVIDQTFDD